MQMENTVALLLIVLFCTLLECDIDMTATLDALFSGSLVGAFITRHNQKERRR